MYQSRRPYRVRDETGRVLKRRTPPLTCAIAYG
jgi:hypothetical protein